MLAFCHDSLNMRLTRLSLLISRFLSPFKKWRGVWNPLLTFCLLLLFVGFMLGSLFSSFLEGLRCFLRWDGLVLTTLVMSVEVTSLFVYSKKPTFFQPLNCPKLFSLINALKVGFLLGLFVDGFKVGS